MKNYTGLKVYQNNQRFFLADKYRNDLFSYKYYGERHADHKKWVNNHRTYSEADKRLLANSNIVGIEIKLRTASLRTFLNFITGSACSMLDTLDQLVKVIGATSVNKDTKHNIKVLQEIAESIDLKSKDGKLVFEEQPLLDTISNLEDTLKPLTNFATFIPTNILKTQIEKLEPNKQSFELLDKLKLASSRSTKKIVEKQEAAKEVLNNHLIPAIRTYLYYLGEFALRFPIYFKALNKDSQQSFNKYAHDEDGFFKQFTQIKDKLKTITSKLES